MKKNMFQTTTLISAIIRSFFCNIANSRCSFTSLVSNNYLHENQIFRVFYKKTTVDSNAIFDKEKKNNNKLFFPSEKRRLLEKF